MTEKEIQLLGFSKREELEEPNPYYYYVYTVSHGVQFISNANDELINHEWHVEFMDSDPAIIFTKFEEVQSLINLLTKRKMHD